jgi:hypothetical protein
MHQQLLKLKYAAVLLTAVLAPTSAVQAATLAKPFETKTFESKVDVQKTNYTTGVSLQKFDSSLGELKSVLLELSGEVQGSMRLESEDASPAKVTGDLAAKISLGNDLLVVLPKVTKEFNFGTYDGNTDYAGASGANLSGLSDKKNDSKLFTEVSEFAPFLGVGTYNLPVKAIAESGGRGAGNLDAKFSTLAGANIRVIYTYAKKVEEPPKKKVPESQVPADVLAAMGLGMVVTRKFRQQG